VILQNCWHLSKTIDTQDQLTVEQEQVNKDENKIKTSKNNESALQLLRHILEKTKGLEYIFTK
jgi:hypothetical protein